MKQKKIKTYKFVLINKYTGEVSFANKLTIDHRYTHYRHRAKWFNKKWDENRHRESFTMSELTFMMVDYFKSEIKEKLKCRKTWTDIRKVTGELDNLKQYYYNTNEQQLKDVRTQLKIWEKKKADLIASPEYMFELLRR